MTISKYQLKHLKKTIKKIQRNDSSATEVVLNGFDFQSDSTLANLCMSLMNNTHVKILYLHGCNITAKGAYLLAFALRSNRSLQHVWLNDNKIGSTGADALASALSTHNRTLLTLGLRNNSIGNRGGKALLRAVKENCSIVGIFLEGNRMSSRIVSEINRITSDEPSDHESDDEYEVYEHDHDYSEYDNETVTGSIVSRSFAAKTLGAIKEVDESYYSEDDESVMSDEVDIDITACFKQKETKSMLSKLKEMAKGRFMKRKVQPNPLR
jgi:Ran GTPase-activating protein (RanGAP) involved in mRNA processing and transport